jgi:hypothetical protein
VRVLAVKCLTTGKFYSTGSRPILKRCSRCHVTFKPDHVARAKQVAGEKLAPEQLEGLVRAGYVYRNGQEHLLTDMGHNALQPGVYPRAASVKTWPRRRKPLLSYTPLSSACHRSTRATGRQARVSTRPESSTGRQFGIRRSAGRASLIEESVAAGDAAMALLLLLAGLDGIMLLGEQFEAHRLRAFIFNFEVTRHRGSADL